ncbi:phage portal protein [Maricaulis maris]|uniref:phage portal protein n=1 Tax=Maricaulis maris TaxID=74318 RepID=UPI003BAD8777
MRGWNPIAVSADGAMAYERDAIDGRNQDLIRNEPAAEASVQKRVDLVIGAGLRIVPKVNADALGLSREEARSVNRALRGYFNAWADDPRRLCDARRRLSLSGLFRLLEREWSSGGECAAVLKRRPARRDLMVRTAIQIIDPIRISNPNEEPDTRKRRAGIEFDDWDAPIAYNIRQGDPLDPWADGTAYDWKRVPRETARGKPLVLHAFEPKRAEQSRGIPDFAPIMKAMKQLGRLDDAELANKVLNATFGAFVESNFDPLAVAEALGGLGTKSPASAWQTQRANHYGTAPVMLGDTRAAVLMPGDSVKLNTEARETADFAQFRAAFLQLMASTLGISYEQLSMDWSNTNYSSARAALNEVWRWVTSRRRMFAEQVVSPIYHHALADIFDADVLDLPASAPMFHECLGGWLRFIVIGPARGYVDPEKEIKAQLLARSGGLRTLENIAAESGEEWEDLLDQLDEENERLGPLGLGVTPVDPGAIASAPAA